MSVNISHASIIFLENTVINCFTCHIPTLETTKAVLKLHPRNYYNSSVVVLYVVLYDPQECYAFICLSVTHCFIMHEFTVLNPLLISRRHFHGDVIDVCVRSCCMRFGNICSLHKIPMKLKPCEPFFVTYIKKKLELEKSKVDMFKNK